MGVTDQEPEHLADLRGDGPLGFNVAALVEVLATGHARSTKRQRVEMSVSWEGGIMIITFMNVIDVIEGQ